MKRTRLKKGGPSISRTYHDAFQIAIANGDQARARVFAERDYDSTVSCEGADSPEARRVQELGGSLPKGGLKP